jgi:hypothetical protein
MSGDMHTSTIFPTISFMTMATQALDVKHVPQQLSMQMICGPEDGRELAKLNADFISKE